MGEMSKLMDDIEDIGFGIELIALNTRIKAARTGAEGDPLGVIAEAIQNLSASAHAQNSLISEELRQIVSRVDRLKEGISVLMGEHVTGVDNILADLDPLLGKLKEMNDTVLSTLGRIRKEGKALAHDIENAASTITVHQRFTQEADDALGALNRITSETEELMPEMSEADKLERLRELEKNYTMLSERDIHHSYAASGNPPAAAIPVSVIGGGNIGELGDNVELF